MKKHLPILLILVSYGCATQQENVVKMQQPPHQPDSVKIDSNQLSSIGQTDSKKITTQAISPEKKRIKIIPSKPRLIIKKHKAAKVTSLKNINHKTAVLSPVPSSIKKTEPTIVAAIEENTPSIKPNNISFNLEQLPLNFGSTWVLDRKKDSVSNITRCLLISHKKKFNDGYSEATISLQLTSDTFFIKTNSTIDMSYPDIGIFIDQNAPLPLEQLFGDSSILIKQNTKIITTQLLQGNELSIKLGFWPTWPKSETRRIDFSLTDFDKAYQSFLACEKL
ncbi:MAG: hypothetical protein GQ532_00125 [Methylomarinum sp.]|nr:hypothetical protein [Methylomarinum sp.]